MVLSKWIGTALGAAAVMITLSCEDSSPANDTDIEGWPLREYSLERSPNVNVWGAGIDLVNDKSKDETSDTDVKYLVQNDTFPFDLKFYTVKAYYTDNSGNIQSEGCPALLLSVNSRACQIGTGIDLFNSYIEAKKEDIAGLKNEPAVDYSSCVNAKGQYDRKLLFAELDSCIIGQRFRSGVVVIPDSKTESEVQPVFLIETVDGGYVKFMVKKFKGNPPDEQKTTVIWQVLSVK